MDTKPSELIGLAVIESEFQTWEIMIARPLSDKRGTDLIACKSFGQSAKFLRLQSKFINLKNSRIINIPTSYVDESFMVCVVVEIDRKKNLYCFFNEDLESTPWKIITSTTKNLFQLSISKKSISNLDDFKFSQAMALKIIKKIESINTDKVMKWYLPAKKIAPFNSSSRNSIQPEIKKFDGLSPHWKKRDPDSGIWITITPCPGQEEDFEYDNIFNVWRAKLKNILKYDFLHRPVWFPQSKSHPLNDTSVA